MRVSPCTVNYVRHQHLDATGKYDDALTVERLYSWHAALFPTGRSGMHKTSVAAWRDDCDGPMQVVSGPVGREKVHYEAPSANRVFILPESCHRRCRGDAIHRPCEISLLEAICNGGSERTSDQGPQPTTGRIRRQDDNVQMGQDCQVLTRHRPSRHPGFDQTGGFAKGSRWWAKYQLLHHRGRLVPPGKQYPQ